MSDQETGRPDYLDDDEEEDGSPLLPPSPEETSGRAADRPIPLPPSSLPQEDQEEGERTGGGGTAPVYPFPTASPPKEPPRARVSAPAVQKGAEDKLVEEADDGTPFNLPGVEKLGIIGGKGVGKSFLFQAMVFRAYSKSQAGAMSLFLEKVRLFHALQREDKARPLSLSEFGKRYMSWGRLPQTLLSNQAWYRLRLHCQIGMFGRKQSDLDVEFFDGSGEGFFEAAKTRGISQIWRDGYLDAKVMVFCLPLWVAFPGNRMTTADRQLRNVILEGFERVVQNYEDLRSEGGRENQRVKSILALTMADDPRSALGTLYEKWISPYLSTPHSYLPRLAKESGVARYLANARQVSEALHRELAASRDPRVSSISQALNYRGGPPWLIPISAVEGTRLDRIERENQTGERHAPVPVHAELPLLVALCERYNALM
jgi:ABC-type dipeptide/oligopeptide/nickel transport system ATPase component